MSCLLFHKSLAGWGGYLKDTQIRHYIVGGKINRYHHWNIVWLYLVNLNIHIPYKPAIQLLALYPTDEEKDLVCMHAWSLRHIWRSVTPWSAAHQFFCPWNLPGEKLEWVATSFSRGPSTLKDRTHVSVSCVGRQSLYQLYHLGRDEILFQLWRWQVTLLSQAWDGPGAQKGHRGFTPVLSILRGGGPRAPHVDRASSQEAVLSVVERQGPGCIQLSEVSLCWKPGFPDGIWLW